MHPTHMTHISALPEPQKEANLTKISHPNSGTSADSSDLVSNILNEPVEVTNDMHMLVPKKPSVEEVIAFGGIPRPTATEVRISERIGAQSDADLTQMERAMKKTQMRNSINSGNHVPKFSIISIPDSEIEKRAKCMGISLGKSFDEVASSINGIKNHEGERTLLILQKNADENMNANDDPASLIVSKASDFCDDLLDDEEAHAEMGDHLDHSILNTKGKTQQRKKTCDLSNIRKSTRIKIRKQYS
jgi:hypothetical protein